MNYNEKMFEIIKTFDKKPKLLLHACCAPCSSYVLELIEKYFEITIYYFNPNMNDLEEYEKRYNEFDKLLKGMNLEHIKVIKPTFDQKYFYSFASEYASEAEGGTRCHLCYRYRLEETIKYAIENGFDYFATTLTVSPYKDAKVINEIGFELEEKYGFKYLPSDFKKQNGYKRSIELSKKYNLYRQNYCGCVYSKIREEGN